MSSSDIFAAFRWWLALMGLGTAVLPITLLIFQKLPGKGYAFTKMVGVLLVSFLFWLLGSLGFVGNNLGGILLAVAVVLALSAWAWPRSQPLAAFRSPDFRRHVRMTEFVFTGIFLLWVWVRAQNPAIAATEKPMEFAFLNSLGRTPTFPPADPWLSGFAISYYYFGYVMTSVIARLAAVAEPVAFNLGIAWLTAGTAVGAYGLVYNLVSHKGHSGHRESKENESAPSAKSAVFSPNARAMLLGLVAAIAIPIAGNLEIGLEMAHANGMGSPQFWEWLDVRDLPAPAAAAETPRYETTSWWWWRSSRVIHEYTLDGRAEEGLEPIAEFPGFSFILGDMHPHVLALPFALLSLMAAFVWYLEAGERKSEERLAFALPLSRSFAPQFIFTALLLGGLSFLNTWDVLIHLFVVLGAYFLGRWQAWGWDRRLWRETAVLALWLVIPAIVLYLPFYLGFRSQAGAPFLLPFLMRPTRLPHFLIIFGMPLSVISLWVAALAVRQRFKGWQNGVRTAVILLPGLLLLMLFLGWVIAASPDGAGRVTGLANDLGLALPAREPGVQFGWGIRAVIILLPTLLSARLAWPGVTLLLAALIALTVAIWTNAAPEGTERVEPELEQEQEGLTPSPPHPLTLSPPHLVTPSPLPFVLLLILTGALLTLGPEFVYLRDNFGQRLNTVFKFYYQAWVLFGVAALFALDHLWREFKRVRWAAAAVYAAAFTIALAFPFYAIQSRAAEFRGPVDAVERPSLTLDGLAQVERFNRDEYDAIHWLRDNVAGTPTILEAVGGQYSQYGRISAATGIPTVLGWAGHEYQWRGPSTTEPGRRDPAVSDIYGAENWNNTAVLLNSLDVQYIYVGGLELSTYGPTVKDKFDGRLDVAYQNNSVTIYRWQPQK